MSSFDVVGPDKISFPPLEKVCDKCGGTRQIKHIQNKRKKTFYMMPCNHCIQGKVLTEFGQAVLDMLSRWNSTESLDDRIRDLEWSLGRRD